MDRADEIFMLFENRCPAEDCGLEIRVINLGGTKEFFAMQPWIFSVDTEVRLWGKEERNANAIIGSVEFYCENDHQHTVEYGKWGEWV